MILLDTHVLVWLRLGDRTLGSRTRAAIEGATRDGTLAVSTITFWEAGMLRDKGRIQLPAEPSAWRASLLRDGLVEIPVDGVIAARAGSLRDIHGDPADRLILATALEGHRLITADARLLDWPGDIARLDARE
jgi:PIN domain nuclease of toxin-antitoxin system